MPDTIQEKTQCLQWVSEPLRFPLEGLEVEAGGIEPPSESDPPGSLRA